MGVLTQARQDSQLSRCFLDTPKLEAGCTYELPHDAVKHLRSLRLQVGDSLELVNGDGWLAQALLALLDKKQATVRTLANATQPLACMHFVADCVLVIATAVQSPAVWAACHDRHFK
jgi:16S rRNA U1498 N3-methylase RsmE